MNLAFGSFFLEHNNIISTFICYSRRLFAHVNNRRFNLIRLVPLFFSFLIQISNTITAVFQHPISKLSIPVICRFAISISIYRTHFAVRLQINQQINSHNCCDNRCCNQDNLPSEFYFTFSDFFLHVWKPAILTVKFIHNSIDNLIRWIFWFPYYMEIPILPV